MPRHDPRKADSTLQITELVSVGLVAAGANGGSDVLITKRADGDQTVREQGSKSRLDGIRRRIRAILSESLPPDLLAAAEPLTDAEFEVALRENLGEWLEAMLHADVTLRSDGLFGDGVVTRDERIALSSALGAALDAFRSTLEDSDGASLYSRSRFDPRPGDGEDVAQAKSADTIRDASPERRHQKMPDAQKLTDEQRATLDEDVRKYVEGLEAAATEAAAEAARLAEEAEKAQKVVEDPETDPTALLKDVDPKIQELVAKAQADADEAKAEAAEAKKAAADEREIRVAAEYVEKASAFGHIAPAGEFGPVLRKIAEAVDPAEFEKIEAALSRVEAIASDGDFFREFGASVTNPAGSTAEKVDRLAKDLAAKTEGMTFEKAYVAVLDSDPDLARAIDDEERARSSRAGK